MARRTPTVFRSRRSFGYDSWRTASNWSVDWSWWQKAPQEQQLSDRIQMFFWSQGISKYGALYSLDGTPVAGPNIESAVSPPVGLVATNAVASLASTNRHGHDFVEALWAAPVPSGKMRYYDGMLYLMSLLHCSGEFRIWAPKR